MFVLRSVQNLNTLCAQNVDFFFYKSGGTYSDHWGLLRLCFYLGIFCVLLANFFFYLARFFLFPL